MKIRQIVLVFLLVAVASGWAQTPSGYEYGLFLLDSHEWDQAVHEFDREVTQGGAQADAAMYWEAYALSKAGRPADALAALAVLRKAFPMSRWLQDGAALEMELKRAVGEHLTPESQSDQELKLLALNSEMRSDPERAAPAVESLLKQAQSPTLKREALYVLALSDSPKAQQLMEQVARGKVDPDLQLLAIRYLVQEKRYQGSLGQLLFETYNSTGDAGVRHEVLMGLAAIGDVAHLSQIPADVAQAAVADLPLFQQRLGLVKTAQAADDSLRSSGKILTEPEAGINYYLQQRDRIAKERIIDAWAWLKVARSLIALARVETDPELKQRIVQHLSSLNTPEAKAYLLEIQK